MTNYKYMHTAVKERIKVLYVNTNYNLEPNYNTLADG